MVQNRAKSTSKARGDWAEQRALQHLQQQGLSLLCRNFKTPGRGGGEIDLIMREPDGTVVFVEVRQRRSMRQGGAAASITRAKQRRWCWAARCFLARLPFEPPCRFDVVCCQGSPESGILEWLPAVDVHFDGTRGF